MSNLAFTILEAQKTVLQIDWRLNQVEYNTERSCWSFLYYIWPAFKRQTVLIDNWAHTTGGLDLQRFINVEYNLY